MKSHSIKVFLFFLGIFFLPGEIECLKKRWLDDSCYLPGVDHNGVPYKPTEFRCGRNMGFREWRNRKESELVEN